ncbi:MAG: threonine/serine dehydratase [Candidatus Odinarchaeota archaeon]
MNSKERNGYQNITNVSKLVREAEKRIRRYIRETPLDFSPYLSRVGKCNAYLKLENIQPTGSFKVRGAINKILSLSKRDVITASSGNHGLAVAHALQVLGGAGIIYLPKNTAQTKIDRLNEYGVELRFYGNECGETEIYARKIAQEKRKTFISPYNDPEIIGGQGTIAIELLRQINDIDTVMVSVGGGGLISGIAGHLKCLNPSMEIIGCIPANSPAMYEAIKAGKIVETEIKPTLSDGTAGGIEPNAITFELCQHYVDHFIVVKEDEIARGIKLVLEKHHMVIEGAAGVTIAAYLKEKAKFEGKNVVLIICGKNIGMDKLKAILCDKKTDNLEDVETS